MIRISVITCTYNAAPCIERTIKSVLSQRFKDVEHLIVDGHSNDDTLQHVHNYKLLNDSTETGHAVVVVSEPDKGLYDAMNKALRMATGDYLVFLNAGDCLPSNDTLEKIASAASKYDVLPGVIYGNTDVVDDRGCFVRHRRLQPHENLSWRDYSDGMLVCHQAFYALTSIAKSIPYNLFYRLSADVDWCISIMKQSEREGRPLCYVDDVIVNYLEGGMSVQNHRASLIERFRIMCHHYGLVQTLVKHMWFVVRAVLKK